MSDTLEQSEADRITQVLGEWASGRPDGYADLWAVIYAELRQIAGAYMRRERPDHTLQATALVHEAYLRVFQDKPFCWHDRKHFFCVMAQAMRRILVDHAREYRADKRGGGCNLRPLDAAFAIVAAEPSEMLALDQALQDLAKFHVRKAQVVELRFFAGLTTDETAAALDISPESVKLDWRFAKAWLQRRMRSPKLNDVA